MQQPLGMDENLWKRRKELVKREYGKHTSWKKGYHAGKQGASPKDNPYQLPPDVWKLLKRRTYWEIGREEALFTPSAKKLRKEKENHHAELRHIKKEFVKKHGKHKHKHHK